MRILVADTLPTRTLERLRADGFEVHAEPKLDGATLTARIAELSPEILVVRSTKVTAEQAKASRHLALVIRAGAGVNTIDVPTCSSLGIFVTNCPGKNAVAVAELTFGLMLAVDRHIADGTADLRAGTWAKSKYSAANGLFGRTLAILGVGDIGREVIQRAKAFGMPVVAWSRSLTAEKADALGIRWAPTPLDAVRDADVISVHLALTAETRGLVSGALFEGMKAGAMFLNTSRAEVVDEAALLTALDAGKIRAGLDVYANEPSGGSGTFDSAVARHPRVVGTHHIGASTEQAQEAVGDEVCRIAAAFRGRGQVLNGVNSVVRSAATHRITVRHHDRVGVLASVLGLLREDEINVQEMENIIFPGGAAIARIQVAAEPNRAVVERLGALPEVLDVSITPISDHS